VTKIEKVTAFVTRETNHGLELLLFKHPYAGIQIPAGTVEPDESPEKAVIREVQEETGLTELEIQSLIDSEIETAPSGQKIINAPATVYSRPDITSCDWIQIKYTIYVKVNRKASGFTQITYLEYDQVPDPNYISMQITGWVPDEFLVPEFRRHFYHLKFTGQSPERWEIYSDYNTFEPFWTPLDDLPKLITPQDQWLNYLDKVLHFKQKRAE
jgi:8-oxo-dGTP pyrophosphatase MutT (NUDIX family)